MGLIMLWLANLSFLLRGTLNIFKVVFRLGTLVYKKLVNPNEIYDFMCWKKAPKKTFIYLDVREKGRELN